MCAACICVEPRFVGFRGVSATPTPQISWHKTTSARFRLLCHPLCTKSNEHMLTPAYAFVNAEKAHLCRRSPCEHCGSGPKCGLSVKPTFKQLRKATRKKNIYFAVEHFQIPHIAENKKI